MAATATTDARAILADYERRVAAVGVQLPGREEVRERWTGVGFRLGDELLLAPMAEIQEVLDPPTTTRVPGTAPWFLGVANVRGSVLPIMDMHGLMIGGRVSAARNARILVYSGEGVSAGFRVDDVFGLKRFYTDERTEAPARSEVLAPYIDGGFRRGEENWSIFSFARFVTSNHFLEVAR